MWYRICHNAIDTPLRENGTDGPITSDWSTAQVPLVSCLCSTHLQIDPLILHYVVLWLILMCSYYDITLNFTLLVSHVQQLTTIASQVFTIGLCVALFCVLVLWSMSVGGRGGIVMCASLVVNVSRMERWHCSVFQSCGQCQ